MWIYTSTPPICRHDVVLNSFSTGTTLPLPNPSSRTIALGSTEPLTEMSTRNLPGWIKGGRRVRLTNLPPSVS
jgi:hypothetical protein